MAKKTLPDSNTDVFASAIANAKQKASSAKFVECNVTPISATERKTWESCTVVQKLSKKGKPYLEAKIVTSDSTFNMPLTRSWEFQRGDTLDIDTITICNLKDAKGKLKLNSKTSKIEWYLYGELE